MGGGGGNGNKKVDREYGRQGKRKHLDRSGRGRRACDSGDGNEQHVERDVLTRTGSERH